MGFMDWLSKKADEVDAYRQENKAKQKAGNTWYNQAAAGLGSIYDDVSDSAGRVADRVGNYAAQKSAEIDAYRQANKAANADGTSAYRQAEKALESLFSSEAPIQGPKNWAEQTLADQALQDQSAILAGINPAAKGLGNVYDTIIKPKTLKSLSGDITKGVTQSGFPMHPSKKKALFNKAIADEQDKRAFEIIMAERAAANNARNYGRSNYGL